MHNGAYREYVYGGQGWGESKVVKRPDVDGYGVSTLPSEDSSCYYLTRVLIHHKGGIRCHHVEPYHTPVASVQISSLWMNMQIQCIRVVVYT